jgi:hypothetical protein
VALEEGLRNKRARACVAHLEAENAHPFERSIGARRRA